MLNYSTIYIANFGLLNLSPSAHRYNLSLIWIWWERTICLIHTEQYLCWCVWGTFRDSWSNACGVDYQLVYIHKQGRVFFVALCVFHEIKL